ncbi:MAG: plasma membrane fusion protein prm1 [Piccolia ochrophora]|nr:MAG: plasma membrane fusion protein prm1 [Piccolia ochrophora]
MPFAEDHRHPSSFPQLPQSLRAGHYEMRDYHSNDETIRAAPNTASDVTPYLGLRARLSQVWINKWTILLLLVLVRTLIAIRSLDDGLDSAKREALSACTGVESMGSAMASMPYYMSQGANELAASGVEKGVNGLMSMLTLSITAVEELVVFFINLLTSTYVCLITLVISGSLHVAINVVKEVKDFLDDSLGDIGGEIKKDVKSFQDSVNRFSETLNSVPALFGGDEGAVPKLDIDEDLKKLDDLKLPEGIDQELDKLNSSIPTFKEVNDFTNDLIRRPFEEVKELVSQSMVAFKFDRSVFPVPQKEVLTFCSDNGGISDFFDKLYHLANVARKTFLAVLIILAILVCVPMAYREIKRWRTMQQRAQLLNKNAFDPLDVVTIASRPYSSTIGIKLGSRFGSTRRQILARWFVAYATSVPALFVLSLGLAGLFACLCQYILLKAVAKETPALANEVGEFAGNVVSKLQNASEQWAVGTNRVIDSTNNDINREVLGWVQTSTGALNDTLNGFVDEMSDALNATFGGTVLYDPIKEVLNCLIGIKIAGIEKGLTWVHDNARVDFPHLPADMFSVGAAASISSESTSPGDSFLADPSSKATDKITNTVVELTSRVEAGIRTEAIISLCVVLVWVFIVVLGLARALTLAWGRDKTRAEGGDDPSAVYATDAYDRPPPGSPERGFPHFGPVSAGPTDEHAQPPAAPWPMARESYVTHPADAQEKLGYAGHRADVAVGSGPLRKSNYGVLSEKR